MLCRDKSTKKTKSETPVKWEEDLTQRRKDAKRIRRMDENAVARQIVDAAYHVHKALGPGLLESVAERRVSGKGGKSSRLRAEREKKSGIHRLHRFTQIT